MRQQTSGHSHTSGRRILVGLLSGFWFCMLTPALSAVADQADQSALQQQIQTQGRLLLGSLRKAREMGLRGDPWAMVNDLDRKVQTLRRRAERVRLERAAVEYRP